MVMKSAAGLAMSKAEDSYQAFAAARGLASAEGFAPGPVTALLVKGGTLIDGVEGVIARDQYRTDGGGFTFNVVFARLPESQPFVPRLLCVRNTRLWTESEVLNERFKVTVSPFQGRQLAAPGCSRRRSSTGSPERRRATSRLSSPTLAAVLGRGGRPERARAGGAVGLGGDGGEANPRRVARVTDRCR
jgi:hypothetical protein